MAITVEHYLNRRPKRRRYWPWLLTLTLAAGGMATLAIGSGRSGATEQGIGKNLDLRAIEHLPDWATEVVHAQQLGADYQFVATVVDLDRDDRLEILLAPAPSRTDVFMAKQPLAVIRYLDQAWHYQATPVSCRPTQLGHFMSNGSWDLPCLTRSGRTVLRWSGSAYVEAG